MDGKDATYTQRQFYKGWISGENRTVRYWPGRKGWISEGEKNRSSNAWGAADTDPRKKVTGGSDRRAEEWRGPASAQSNREMLS